MNKFAQPSFILNFVVKLCGLAETDTLSGP